MKKKITIKENNEIKTITKMEPIITQLFKQAVKGNSKHLQLLLGFLESANAMLCERLDAQSLEKAIKVLHGG